MERFLGGTPAGVIIRLVIISIIVGIVLAALGLQPFDVFDGVRRLIARIYEMGFEAVEKAASYFLTGALIVVPIWLIARLIGTARSRKDKDLTPGP